MSLALDPQNWGLLIFAGCLVGCSFGLFGRMGGLAVAPVLLVALPYCGLPQPAVPKVAAATAIAILIPIAIAQAEETIRRGAVDWDLFTLLAPSAAVGAVFVTTFADYIDGRLAALALLAGTAFLGIRSVFAAKLFDPEKPSAANPPLISIALKTFTGGASAALIGVSASLFSARTLAKTVNADKASATASALTLPFALVASGGYFLTPAPSGCGAACAGAIFLPGLAAIGMTAVLSAPLALRLRPLIPIRAASRIFAALVVTSAFAFGLPSQSLPDLMIDTRERALDFLLGSICDHAPSPATPAFKDDEPEKRLAQTPMAGAEQSYR